jgi:hypothetical protein
MLPRALLVILESPFTLFAPGFFLARRLPLDPSEKAACSVGGSIFILYLYSLLVFVLGLPAVCHVLFTAGCFMITWRCRKDLRLFFALPEVQGLFLSFVVLLIWTAALLELVRNYSGGGWMGDWYEHYHRAMFFVRRLPPNTIFLGEYTLPARPPLFNLVSGHFLAEVGGEYPIYQVAAMLLNLTAFFPASLFFRRLAPRAATGPLPLAIVMGLNPSVMQNATYPWTKLLTVSYVLLGLWFYCRFLGKREMLALYLAFAAVSIGFLTHYSAGPYVVLLVAHYLWRRLRKPRWKEMAGLLTLIVLILSTWFGWSIAHYGSQVTSGSNTSVALDAQRGPVETLQTIAGNLRDTLVPPFLRANDPGRNFEFSMAALHNYSFLVYQTNLFLALGSAGWLIAVLQASRLALRVVEKSLLYFWAWLVPGAVVLGIGVVGERDLWGLAHFDLQPVILLGLILVAAAWPTISKPLRLLMFLGLSCDLALGMALHFAYEHWLFPLESVSAAGYFNWRLKQDHQLAFIGDYWPCPLLVAEALLLCLVLYRLYHARADATQALKDIGGK